MVIGLKQLYSYFFNYYALELRIKFTLDDKRFIRLLCEQLTDAVFKFIKCLFAINESMRSSTLILILLQWSKYQLSHNNFTSTK